MKNFIFFLLGPWILCNFGHLVADAPSDTDVPHMPEQSEAFPHQLRASASYGFLGGDYWGPSFGVGYRFAQPLWGLDLSYSNSFASYHVNRYSVAAVPYFNAVSGNWTTKAGIGPGWSRTTFRPWYNVETKGSSFNGVALLEVERQLDSQTYLQKVGFAVMATQPIFEYNRKNPVQTSFFTQPTVTFGLLLGF